MTKSALFGEKYLSKVGAAFDGAEDARAAMLRVRRDAGIAARQIRLLEPDDPGLAQKLEPESGGIARTLAKAHITLGAAGLVLGLLIAAVLVAIDIDAFAWNPWYTVMVFAFFGAIAGLMLGGLVSLRPDHERLIAWVQSATRRGHWLVLVHARDHDEERKAKEALASTSDTVVGTF
jgi:hypothetical protein